VAGCFDLVDEIYNARGKKPIHAILTENAYSAAYAIASAADRISVPEPAVWVQSASSPCTWTGRSELKTTV
jgi:ClpP class serine protease